MNPNASTLWRHSPAALAFLLACLSMLGPFSIDTYLPAFAGISRSLDATPLEMQQTLSVFLLGFAVMNLFHGALSDSFGRRPLVLGGMGVFAIASLGCALAPSVGWLIVGRALQGMSAGAGVVVSRAIIRDMFPPSDAQRVMSQVTIYFGIAPAVAPIVGGVLFTHVGWRAVFWFLTAISSALWLANWRLLPETLDRAQAQPIHLKHLLRGYWQLGSNPRFFALALASGVPFNGMFLYVLSAPAFLGEQLRLSPERFFWLFLLTVSGIMGGAWWSGRLAGRIRARDQVRRGFVVMLLVSVANVALNLALPLHPVWALPPIGLFAFGWALMVPVVTLMVLDLVPERRGMASSLQAFVGSTANALVAGVVSPLVMHSSLALALASMALMATGLLAWLWVKPRLPR
jgi:DHA1 family bicyclomycin/chloramphenicol resistance-like MFS transporter